MKYETVNYIKKLVENENYSYSLTLTQRGLEIFKTRVKDSVIVKRLILETFLELITHCSF